jgi:DNA invertase Pin-like site-specific DNA recombinase
VHKVALINPSAGINISSVPTNVFLDALDSIAEFKHSVAVESINAGIAGAQARGVKLGRPVTIDAHREDVARLRAQGRTGRAIAKELGLPNSKFSGS